MAVCLYACICEITTIRLVDQAFVKQALTGRNDLGTGSGVNFYAAACCCDGKLQQKIEFFERSGGKSQILILW